MHLPSPRIPLRLPLTLFALGLMGMSLTPGCRVGYLVRSGYFQAELLLSREPVDEVRSSGKLSEEAMTRLDLVADVKSWGREMGLSATDNYETVALEWQRQIWNVSACEPLSFTPQTWWFPIVGTMPYLGYFRKEDADARADDLRADELDVYVRTAGAYSTLGWFKDPILPQMLTWDDFNLADTVLHELAHATLWVPGSVKFNESFANFVGEAAATRYLQERRGSHDPQLAQAVGRLEDLRIYRALQHTLYQDLSELYEDPSLTDAEKLRRKQEILTVEWPARVAAAPFNDPTKFVEAATKGVWNNARLMQFKTYNTHEDVFAAILEQEDGDILRFINRVGELTHDERDPFAALRRGAGFPEAPEGEE
ncbi:MAG: aminopeptidase [Deltaproteobacteria bacterium]|nr:aminopeptidase [Deltaproteobacteria bacterium]